VTTPYPLKAEGVAIVQNSRLVTRAARADAFSFSDQALDIGQGKSAGPTCLNGVLMPFEKLGNLPQVEKSKYIQHVLAHRES
jgi:hypothetical protein